MTLLGLRSLLAVIEIRYLLWLLTSITGLCELGLLWCWPLGQLLLGLVEIFLRMRTLLNLLLVLCWALHGCSIGSVLRA